jgi:hypothetical protein
MKYSHLLDLENSLNPPRNAPDAEKYSKRFIESYYLALKEFQEKHSLAKKVKNMTAEQFYNSDVVLDGRAPRRNTVSSF